jgi:transposase
VTELGYPVAEVATRIGVSQHSLYLWIKPEGERQEAQGPAAEMRRLKAELKRVTKGRIPLYRPESAAHAPRTTRALRSHRKTLS